MTKADLIEKIAKDAGITKVAAKAAMESFLDGVKKGLKKRNSRVTLVGFGTFKNVYRKTRMGRNPQTGENIFIVFCRVNPFPRFTLYFIGLWG